MDKSEVSQKINATKASYVQYQKSNEESQIVFEFIDEKENIYQDHLKKIPNGDIIVNEFENSNKLTLKIHVDGMLKSQKVLFEIPETQSNSKIEFVQHQQQAPVIDKESGAFLQNIVRSLSEGNDKYLNSALNQLNVNFAEMKTQSKEATEFVKDFSLKTSSIFKEILESQKKDTHEQMQNQIKFMQDQAKINEENLKTSLQNQMDHIKNMNELEKEKMRSVFELEKSRAAISTDKTTPAEWSKIVSESVPEFTKAFREVIEGIRAIKDMEVKEVKAVN